MKSEKAVPASPPSSGVSDAPGWKEMYAALERVESNDDRKTGYDYLIHQTIMEQVKAALAKAREPVPASPPSSGVTSILRTLEELHGLAYDVAAFDWGTSVSEAYHNLRMARMDALRTHLSLKTETLAKARGEKPNAK